jgi:hypothetical protein
MPNYQNTIIYKIVCNDENITDIYVGSTTNFNKRKAGHKTICINEKSKHHNLKIYETIRLNGGWNNWKMLEIEKYPCNTSIEAHDRERYYYEMLNSTMNIQVPTRTIKQYYETNKTKIINQQKQYYETNKTKIIEQKRQYYETNKTKIDEQKRQYYETNKTKIFDQQKQYYETNKTKIIEQKRQYYEANKVKINEYNRQQYYQKKKLEKLNEII